MKAENNVCPSCGSKDVNFNEKEDKYVCTNCETEYLNETKNNLKDNQKEIVVSSVKRKPLYTSSKKVAVCGIFGGLALLLYLVELFRIPMGFLFSAAPFLKLNFSDLPIMIAGFCYGPVTGAIIVGIKTLCKCLMTHTGFVGELSDLFVSLAYVVPAALIYRFNKSKKGAIIALSSGTLISAFISCFTNYFISLPLYRWKLDYFTTIFAGILPFNLLKGTIVSILVFLVYKKISNVIHKYGAK
jgi:riboflavin transporter FmnP/DNA-directed RNA polymerase subunit RPC12/RpoP